MCVCVCVLLSHVRVFATPWTVDCQPPLSSRQGYWSGLPFPSPGDLPDPGIEPGSPALPAEALPSELLGKPMIFNINYINIIYIYTINTYSLLDNIFIFFIEVSCYLKLLELFLLSNHFL